MCDIINFCDFLKHFFMFLNFFMFLSLFLMLFPLLAVYLRKLIVLNVIETRIIAILKRFHVMLCIQRTRALRKLLGRLLQAAGYANADHADANRQKRMRAAASWRSWFQNHRPDRQRGSVRRISVDGGHSEGRTYRPGRREIKCLSVRRSSYPQTSRTYRGSLRCWVSDCVIFAFYVAITNQLTLVAVISLCKIY